MTEEEFKDILRGQGISDRWVEKICQILINKEEALKNATPEQVIKRCEEDWSYYDDMGL